MVSRIYKGKKYYKYVVVIPEGDMKKSGLKEGEEIDSEAKGGEIKLKRK